MQKHVKYLKNVKAVFNLSSRDNQKTSLGKMMFDTHTHTHKNTHTHTQTQILILAFFV